MMLRIFSSKLFLARYPITYFSSKESQHSHDSLNEEIELLKEYINIENREMNKDPGSYGKVKVRKETSSVIRPKIKLRDRIRKQKWKTLSDIVKDNPEFMQAVPAARQNVIPVEGQIDYGFDILPVAPAGKYDHSGKYFDSLGYKRKEVTDKYIHERIRENEMQFVDAYLKPGTPAKCLMTEQEKEAVHLEIDKKMQELEDTGLSRHEILNKPKGNIAEIPLKDDPVFQLIKENRIVRESFVTAHEEFSADKVIRKALEQNLGPDPSLANFHSRYLLKEHVPDKDKPK